MMNIGQEKGRILEDLIRTHKPKSVLEIGTFLGYSTIRMARTLQGDDLAQGRVGERDRGARIISIEKDPVSAEAAETIIRKSGVSMKDISLLVGSSSERLAEMRALNGNRPFDFIFMDHWKEEYDDDLQQMERLNFMHRGTIIVADNVICPGAPEYLAYLDTHSDRYKTEIIDVPFEYRPDTPDGMSVTTCL